MGGRGELYDSSHDPQGVLLTQFVLDVHKLEESLIHSLKNKIASYHLFTTLILPIYQREIITHAIRTLRLMNEVNLYFVMHKVIWTNDSCEVRVEGRS